MNGSDLHRGIVGALQAAGYHYAGDCPHRHSVSQHDPQACSKCSRILKPWVDLHPETQDFLNLMARPEFEQILEQISTILGDLP